MYTWGYIKDVCLAKLDLDESEATDQNLLSRFPFYANEVITQVCSAIKPKHTFAKFGISREQVGIPQKMPDDFVSFGDDVCYTPSGTGQFYELYDSDFKYNGYNEVVFSHEGLFYISYNARWYTFDKSIDDNTVIDIPNDILDCIPSYVASQCYKIDDVSMAQIYRNEYELMLARINDVDFKNTKTIEIEGGW